MSQWMSDDDDNDDDDDERSARRKLDEPPHWIFVRRRGLGFIPVFDLL